jgi:hypothetical protein
LALIPTAVVFGFGQLHGKQGLYQSSQLVTDSSPVAPRDADDFPGLFDEGIPGIAAVIDDVVEGFEDPI